MRPSLADRIAKHNADNAEREKQESIQVARAVAHRKLLEEFERWKEQMGFNIYLTALQILMRLEEIRDLNTPEDEEWNNEFCTAIELIPQARQFYEDTIMDCTEVKLLI